VHDKVTVVGEHGVVLDGEGGWEGGREGGREGERRKG
jgi:hypothetical protein